MDLKRSYLDWDDIGTLCHTVISEMQNDKWIPTVVVGLTRGGLAPATMISHYLNIPMCSLDISLRDNKGPFGGTVHTWIPEEIANGHRILVMDDINDSGATFKWIKNDWESSVRSLPPVGKDWPWNMIKFGCLVHNIGSEIRSDYHGMQIDKTAQPEWICFPWETWFADLR